MEPANDKLKFLHMRAGGVSSAAFDAWMKGRPKGGGESPSSENEIEIYGLILSEGDALWARLWGDESVTTAQSFRQKLKKMKGPVTLRINSDGGDVFEASAIQQAIEERDDVKCIIDGIAASAASLVACSCADVTIAKMGQVMIHNSSAWMAGTSSQFLKMAETLSGIDVSAAKVYANRAKALSEDEIKEMMQKETYMTAEEAVDLGFADRIYAKTTDNMEDVLSIRDARMQAIIFQPVL